MIGYGMKIRHRQALLVDVLAAKRVLETGIQGYVLPYPLAGILPQLAHN
jgi:hypothetical protein